MTMNATQNKSAKTTEVIVPRSLSIVIS